MRMSFEELLGRRTIESVTATPREIADQPGLVSEQEALDVVQFASRYFSVIEAKLPADITGPMPEEA